MSDLLALKKLVGNKIAISDDDLQKGFEANYGERVRCLAIVLNDMRRAQQDRILDCARHSDSTRAASQRQFYGAGSISDASNRNDGTPPRYGHGRMARQVYPAPGLAWTGLWR